MSSRFYACDMSGAGLESGKAPSTVVARNVEDALSDNSVSIGIDDGSMAFVEPICESGRFAGLKELGILIEESWTDPLRLGQAAPSSQNDYLYGVADLGCDFGNQFGSIRHDDGARQRSARLRVAGRIVNRQSIANVLRALRPPMHPQSMTQLAHAAREACERPQSASALAAGLTEAVAYSGGRDSLATFPVGH